MQDAAPWSALLAPAVGAPVGTHGGKKDAETPGFVGNVGDAISPAWIYETTKESHERSQERPN